MADSDWTAGYELQIFVNGVQAVFGKVEIAMSRNLIPRPNSKYTPSVIPKKGGQKSLVMTAEGPYKIGEVPISIDGEYTMRYLPHAAHVGYEFVGLVAEMRHGNDVEGGPMTYITVENQSTFTPVIA